MDAELFARHGQILARAAEGDDVHGINLPAINVRNAAELPDIRETRRSYLHRERFYLRRPQRLYPAHGTGKRETANTIKETSKRHSSFTLATVNLLPAVAFVNCAAMSG